MAKTIAIDIGHGSNTFPPGKGVYKNGKGYAEHDFNSKLSIEIDKLLRGNGFKVIMYQKPYTNDVSLTKRTNYYNSQGVDLVYSIHANASGSSSANGRCVFYWYTAKDSKRLADIVVSEIKEAGYSTHGNGLHASKPGSWTNLHICRETNMTAVLVENGFMTGNKDFDLVFGSKQDQYVKDMAVVHTKAICKYYGVKYTGRKASGGAPTLSNPAPNKTSQNTSKPSTSGSVVDYMKSKGMDSSYSNRAKLAKQYGIKGFSGSPKDNITLLAKLKAGKPSTGSSASGSLKSKVNGLRFYNKPSWSDKDVIGTVNKGVGFPTIVRKLKVGNGHQYQVKNSKGATYYITASPKYVTTSGGVPKSKPKAPSYKVGSKVKIKSTAKKYTTGENIPSRFKNKSYTIQQVKGNKVLLKEIYSWVYKKDVR